MSQERPLLHVEIPASRTPERRYVTDVLLRQFLGLSYVVEVTGRYDVRITAPEVAPEKEVVVDDCFFVRADPDWLGRSTVPAGPTGVWANPTYALPTLTCPIEELPVVFGHPLTGGEYLELTPERARMGIDVFGSSFFFLTRYEEAVPGERDRHGRFSAGSSLAAKAGFLRRPIVNEYVEILWGLIRWLVPAAMRRSRRFALVLSHDVDSPACLDPSRGWARVRGLAGAARRRRSELGIFRVLSNTLTLEGRRRLDPCNTFDWLMGVSERVGVKSAFYFLAGPTSERPKGRYSIDDPWIRSLIRRIASRGHEIGLHPTYDTWRDAALTKREFDRLLKVAEEEGVQQEVWGGRQHYLRWANPHTWQNWEEAGLDYDSTLGFADAAGFRCGVCYEYPAFNLLTRTPLRLRERPLVAMDVSLFQYMNLSPAEGRELLLELAAACRRYQGQMTLLWHNSNLPSAAQKALYREIIEAIAG